MMDTDSETESIHSDQDLEKVPVRGFSLRTKILAGTLTIVFSSLFLISAYFIYFYHQEIKRTLLENLRVAKETYSKVNKLQISRMEAVLSSIRYSPRFIASIGMAMGDLASLRDTVDTEFRVSGVDLFMIMNSEGEPLVGLSRDVRGFLSWAQSEKLLISNENFVRIHLDEDLYHQLGLNWGTEEIFKDMTVYRNFLYQVISAPLYDREDNFIGVILLGSRVNREMVAELAKVTGADIGFLSEKGVFATSLSKSESEELKKFHLANSQAEFQFQDRVCLRAPVQNAASKKLGYLVVMKSMRIFHEKVKNLAMVSGGVISFVILIAIIISLLTSQKIVKPLKRLSLAFTRVGKGELDFQVKISSGDELETLSKTFNTMVADLKKKETMSRFLTGMEMEEVDAISSGKKAMSMIGEKKQISVLFSDIRSFTSICEKTDAELIINALNYYFDVLIPIIEKNGGFLDKLIGDCIMAVFEDRDGRKSADNAIAAAIAMQAKLTQIRPEMEKLEMPSFRAGFGINTGECVIGNVGTSNQLSRTALGDGVNLAARVESLSKEGKRTCILFTKATLDAMEQKIDHEFLMETVVKGKSTSIGVYEVGQTELNKALNREEKVEL